MLNRQKALLALISESGEVDGRVRLFKYAFLLKEEAALPASFSFYDFLPYKFGPYSFTLEREILGLTHQSYIQSSGSDFRIHPSMRTEVARLIEGLDLGIRQQIRNILNQYGSLPQRHLIEVLYSKYPGYAIASQLTALTSTNLRKPEKSQVAIYTMGYEGNSIDRFLHRIISKGLSLVLDVRANPVSRKYGFAKSTFSRLAPKLGLGYHHLASLGIPSSERRGVTSAEDFKKLFERYTNELLSTQSESLAKAEGLLRSQPTVLVCRESAHESCHRSRLASVLQARTGLSVVHL